jgi:hypothetical protein
MQDIYEVFSGSSVDANFIKAYLEDNGIGVFIRNAHQSSIAAGWIDPVAGTDVAVMVTAENFERAESLVRQYLESRD